MESGKQESVADKFPKTQEEADEAARMLEEEMQKLSLKEHEEILFDVHGVDQCKDEDPEDIEGPIAELEQLIHKEPEKASYNKAKYFNQEYVNDKKFLLMFLRSDRFDTKLAAKRLAKHFDVKEKLFGSGEILGRDIRLSDMTEEDIMILESGYIQILPRRDLAGRCILFCSMTHRPVGASLAGLNRTYWYMLMASVKDEETQKKGLVNLVFNTGTHARADPTLVMTQLDSVVQAMPKKYMGLHYCFNDEALTPYVTGVHMFLDKSIKTRFRSHFGENANFELQTYGIPVEDQPLHPNGDISLAWHRDWLNVQRTQEDSEGAVEGTVVPRRFDVLFGRGKGSREHTGNLRAVHLVEVFQQQYEEAERAEKRNIAVRVVAMIQESLGRFLKWEDHGWVEVSDEVATEKIAHFFRHRRSKQMPHRDSSSLGEEAGKKAKRITPSPDPACSSDDRTTKQFRTENRAL